jgi:NADPH-dependent 2,4-dienoyl-CoA reductase/sulfur reductase-like enzyme
VASYREQSVRSEHSLHQEMSETRRAARADGVVVVGAGQAGGRAVESLRNSGFIGRVTLIGDEHERPYERPSLSKEMLLDQSAEAIVWLHHEEFYETQDVEFRPGIRATSIDRQARRVHLSDGGSVGYGALILATGARPRQLELAADAAARVMYLRTLVDSRKLRQQLPAARSVAVVGAGFIGLEVAAAARQRGCSATIIEAARAPLGRVAPAEVGSFYEQLHRRHGVLFRFGTQVADVDQADGQRIVRTDSNELVGCDILVAGIGVIPNDDLAADAGLSVNRGIVVDEFGAASDPSIFAVGDVARQFNRRLGRHILLESWSNAQNQAIAIAKNIGGDDAPAPYDAVPWFWSDQYGQNLQMYGLAEPGGETVMRGSFDDKSWILIQTLNDRITSMVGLNAARDLRAGRDLIGVEASRSALVNRDTSLGELSRRLRHLPVPLP